jgi:hypothetical protein
MFCNDRRPLDILWMNPRQSRAARQNDPATIGVSSAAKACARRNDSSALQSRCLGYRYQKGSSAATWQLAVHVFFFDIRREAALALRLEISLNERPD